MKHNGMTDIVKKPSHYTGLKIYGLVYPSENKVQIECKDVIRGLELNYQLGSAFKYLWRAGRKDDKIQDLEKAKQMIEFEIEDLKKEALTEPRDCTTCAYFYPTGNARCEACTSDFSNWQKKT